MVLITPFFRSESCPELTTVKNICYDPFEADSVSSIVLTRCGLLPLHSSAVWIPFSQFIDECVIRKRIENCENQNISHFLLLALDILGSLVYQRLDYFNCLLIYLCVCLYAFHMQLWKSETILPESHLSYHCIDFGIELRSSEIFTYWAIFPDLSLDDSDSTGSALSYWLLLNLLFSFRWGGVDVFLLLLYFCTFPFLSNVCLAFLYYYPIISIVPCYLGQLALECQLLQNLQCSVEDIGMHHFVC